MSEEQRLRREVARLRHELRQSVAMLPHLRRMVESSGDPLLLLDGQSLVIACNGAFGRLVGEATSTIQGQALRRWLSLPQQAQVLVGRLAALAPADTLRMELELRGADGVGVPMEVEATSLAPANQPGEPRWTLALRDVSDRRRLEAGEAMLQVQAALLEDLRGSEERQRRLVERLDEGLALLDPELRFRYANPAMHAILGGAAGALEGSAFAACFADCLAPEERTAFAQRCGALRAGHDRHFGAWVLTGQKGRRLLQLQFSPLQDQRSGKGGFMLLARDVTDLHRARRELERLAFQDGLTGLGNEESSRRHLAGLLERQAGARVAVLWFDLDDFRRVNHSFGRQAGDRLLRQVALQLRRWSRPDDWLARLGGDEFLVIRPRLVRAEALAMAADLQAFLAASVRGPEGDPLALSFCGGLSLHPSDGADAETLLRHAATALGLAHDQGQGVVLPYERAFTDELRDQLDLERRLRQALAQGGLRLVYQPQVDQRQRLIGSEALLRWSDPELGPVSPARFIPVAERSGLIHALGRWVLEAACSQQRLWLDAGLNPPPVAVNVSPRQFTPQNPGMVSMVGECLVHHALTPALLELEITESCILPISGIGPDLERLVSLGLTLAIDDFGTGFSSLSSLHRLPLHKLKIDQSFVAGLEHSEAAHLIVRTAAAMGRGLGMRVVVEGVETEGQFRILEAMGCDAYQGYLFSRPLEVEAFAERLRDQICHATADH